MKKLHFFNNLLRISGGVDHYLVCDKNGDVLVVKFLDGKAVYHYGNTLAAPVLENSLYGEQADAWLANKPYIEASRFAAMADALGRRNRFADAEAMIGC